MVEIYIGINQGAFRLNACHSTLKLESHICDPLQKNLANLNNLEILSRGAPIQQDVVDLTIHYHITQ